MMTIVITLAFTLLIEKHVQIDLNRHQGIWLNIPIGYLIVCCTWTLVGIIRMGRRGFQSINIYWILAYLVFVYSTYLLLRLECVSCGKV